MRRKLAEILYLGLILHFTGWLKCVAQVPPWNPVGVGPPPPPMPLHHLPADPERQADMMESRMRGFYGNNFYPPQYPRLNPFNQPQPPNQGFAGAPQPYPLPPHYYSGRSQIIPLNNVLNSRSPTLPADAPNPASNQITSSRSRNVPPPQNLNRGTVFGNNNAHTADRFRPRPERRMTNNRPTPATKSAMLVLDASMKQRPQRPQIFVNSQARRLPQQRTQQFKVRRLKTPVNSPAPARPTPANQPSRRDPPPQPRQSLRPPGPPSNFNPAVGGMALGSQDGPCVPISNRALHKTYNGGYPPVRHQPRVPYSRRYRRAVYNLTGCVCTDIQDIDPLGGEGYITKAGYCHAFQYYCLCPPRLRTGLPPPRPG